MPGGKSIFTYLDRMIIPYSAQDNNKHVMTPLQDKTNKKGIIHCALSYSYYPGQLIRSKANQIR